ncbi:tape measure domain-containing protein, partial [gut metagenome]
KQFSNEIEGIDGEAVSNAAIAGKTLAEMADTLPNSGGVVGFFAGENDMETFGDQLVPFGRAMKAFADEVTGLDAAVVQEAATAGKAMVEMAATIPNSGGVVSFFAGENDMNDFGEQLIPFGKAMKEYADAVSGLNADVIQNSVVAGQALLELAHTVPNTGGAVSWFTGDNDLETFGEQLVPFGTAMKNYSLAVAGIDAEVIINSANAAKALAELSNNLPNTGGIVSWFTGDNDIASFGEQLVTFGQSFANYYNSVSGVDATKLSAVVA